MGEGNFFGELKKAFGWRYLMLSFFCFTCIKGIAWRTVALNGLPYFKSYLKQPADVYQRFSYVLWMPWSAKPLIAGISDSLPIRGYHKRWYLVFSILFGVVGFALLGFVPFARLNSEDCTDDVEPTAELNNSQRSCTSTTVIGVVQFLFIGATAATAAVDTLMEGHYTGLVTANPQMGSRLVSWVWGCVQVGVFAPTLWIGPLADHVSARIAPVIAMLVCIPSLWCLLRGWLSEKKQEVSKFKKELVKQHIALFVLGGLMATCATTISLLAMLMPDSSNLRVGVGVVMCIMLTGCGIKFLPSPLGRVIVVIFLQDLLYLRIPGALDYWYTAKEDCVPDGPHFSYTYYNTWTAAVASFAGFVGIWLFNKVLCKFSIRVGLTSTLLMRVIASMADFVIIKRWNLALGINDHVAYMLGDAIIATVVEMMNFMCGTLFISKICPKDVEAVTFAIFAGFANFGVMLGGMFGEVLMDWFGVSDCNYSALPMLVVVAHALPPLISIVLVWALIPPWKPDAAIHIHHHEKLEEEELQQADDGDGQEESQLGAAPTPEPSPECLA